jgi:hypothetical protein
MSISRHTKAQASSLTHRKVLALQLPATRGNEVVGTVSNIRTPYESMASTSLAAPAVPAGA